jgi:hypothetical protein
MEGSERLRGGKVTGRSKGATDSTNREKKVVSELSRALGKAEARADSGESRVKAPLEELC